MFLEARKFTPRSSTSTVTSSEQTGNSYNMYTYSTLHRKISFSADVFFFPLYVNHSYIKKVNFQYKMLNHYYRRGCRGEVFLCAKKTVDVRLDISLTRGLTRGMRGVGVWRTRAWGSYSIFTFWVGFFLDLRDYKVGIELHLTSYKWNEIARFRCFSRLLSVVLGVHSLGGIFPFFFFLRLSVRLFIGCVHEGSRLFQGSFLYCCKCFFLAITGL